MTNKELIKAVREHAVINYGRGGWDYVVESWSDFTILGSINEATTVSEAISEIGKIVGTINDVRSDIENEVFQC